MTLCSKCKVNPAMVFITKIENGKTVSEGLCLACAKELGIAPVDEMMKQMGINEEDLDELTSQVNDFLSDSEGIEALTESMGIFPEDIEGVDNIEGGAPTAPTDIFKKLFNSFPSPSGSTETPPKGDNKSKKKQNSNKKSMLDTYGTNLTVKAALGKVDRVIHRDSEIERVIQILNRRSKNNPVLLGEPGVGKTAVAEGLACRIFEKNVPPKLLDYQLYLIDFTALVAGTQFRGQFEARLKNLLSEAAEAGNVILVIDEIHNIVAAGDAEGAMSAANILKPALARGEIQIIGATTLTEYRKHIEKDSALERRFQPVIIDEPDIQESIEILKGIKDYYQDYHKVKISDKIIEKAVRMSERYITERFLPDKAIDVIDEAGSAVNLKNKALYELSKTEAEMSNFNEKIEKATSEGDFETSANLRSEQMRMSERIQELKKQASLAEITEDDVAAVIEAWTKIPVHRLTEDETEKLINLETLLHKRVIGQDNAVNSVARAIRRGRADITTRKRPVSFIFAGPTGVGKTELVKTIAEVMFGSEESLIRLDMSEYMEKHAVSKLIGSPPGYVGYDEAGQLTEKVRRKPYSVILLDEIEKADPEVFNMFLQILDDGRIADSHGKIINFENTIIIMTTNAGSEISTKALGFGSSIEDSISDNVEKSLKKQFRPEFLNRIDEIITFKPLTKDELRLIIDLLLKDIVEKMTEKGATFNITVDAKEIILSEGYDSQYGARPLKRAIQNLIEDELSKLALAGEIKFGTTLLADAENKKIIIRAINA